MLDPEYPYDWESIQLRDEIPYAYRISLSWPLIVLTSLHDTEGGRTRIPSDHFLKVSVNPLIQRPEHETIATMTSPLTCCYTG